MYCKFEEIWSVGSACGAVEGWLLFMFYGNRPAAGILTNTKININK